MAFTTAFGSQEEPLEAVEDAPFTQMGDFVSQAHPTAPSLDRPKRPLHDASPDDLERNKRPRGESVSDLAREVQAELARQRRTDQLMKILGRNQGDRLPVEETEAEANSNSMVRTSQSPHQEQQDRAEIERHGINFEFLEEQLAKIGDVSNLTKPEDEILFDADDVSHKTRPRGPPTKGVAQPASQASESVVDQSDACSDDTASDQEHSLGSAHSLPAVQPIIKPLPSRQSESSLSALTSSRSPASSSASSDANVAAGSQEVKKDLAQSESSDSPVSWPSSPARSVQCALERRSIEALPPDSSGPWPRDGSVGPQRESESRLSASSAPCGVEDHHMLSRNTVSGRNEMMYDKNAAEADFTDSDIDEVEPHALGEEVADDQASGELRRPAIVQSVVEVPAPQVKETPYPRRAQFMAMSGDGAFLSTHERTPSNPTRTPQTLIPSTIPKLTDNSRDDMAFQDNSVRSCVEDAVAMSSDKPTSGVSQSAASDIIEIVSERRASMSQHAGGKIESKRRIVSRTNDNGPDRWDRPAMERDGVGASLNLSSQRLVLEDPAVTARRTRREFMARVAHSRKVSSTRVSPPQLISSNTEVPQPDATTWPQAEYPPSPKAISSAEPIAQSDASSTHAVLSQPPVTSSPHVAPPSEAASASIIRSLPSTATSRAVVSPRPGSPSPSNAVSSQQASPSQGTSASSDARVSTEVMPRATSPSQDTPSKHGSQASRFQEDSMVEIEGGETGSLHGGSFGIKASDMAGCSRQDPTPLDDVSAHDESTNEGSDFGSKDHSVIRSASEQQSKLTQGACNLWYTGDTPFKTFARNYRRLKIMEGVLKDSEGQDKATSRLNVLEWRL